jgi:cell wall-associated NlpC family hydrolase
VASVRSCPRTRHAKRRAGHDPGRAGAADAVLRCGSDRRAPGAPGSSLRPALRHAQPRIGILRTVRRRIVVSSVLVIVAAVALAAVLSSSSSSSGERVGASAAAKAPATRTPRAMGDLPTRNRRAKVVAPVAGETAAEAALPVEDPADATPAPTGAASATSSARLKRDTGPSSDAAVSQADVLKNGIALPPIEAPQAVRQIIEAGNSIARTPYLWGGGHGKWLDKGYDCSGSVSYALASAGLLNAPLDSGRLMGWGAPGPGRWVTIYTNPGHVYLVVAGVRFDTSGTRSTGSRWQKSMRSGGGFVTRHPPGL